MTCSGHDVGVPGLGNRGVVGPVGQLPRKRLLLGSLVLVSAAVFDLAECRLGTPNCFCRIGHVRYATTLKLQDRKGKVEERAVVFMVALKSPLVVARDPYE